MQPVLESLDAEAEEAAGLLGATRWQTFRRVILPTLLPGLLTGFALAFARGLGEYGSVVFVSGNMPFKTEIAPVLIVGRLEEGRPNPTREATAIAIVLLVVSFLMLVVDQPAGSAGAKVECMSVNQQSEAPTADSASGHGAAATALRADDPAWVRSR